MEWIDVENIVVGYVRERFNTLSRRDPERFTREFSAAYKQLKNLNQNPDYDLPLIGDAYCLKYHLLRMDNLTTALDHVHKAHPLLQSPESAVLDMCSGTGGSAMAIARWVAINLPLESATVAITSSEPVAHIRATAKRLVPILLDKLFDTPPFPISIRFADKTIAAGAERCRNKKAPFFDLIVFSYALWKQSAEEWNATTSDILSIAETLKPDGVLLFLTPKSPIEKVRFMGHLTSALKGHGFRQLSISIPLGKRCAPIKHPPCLQTLLTEINDTCNDLTGTYPLGPLFGRDPDDRPYYGFYGTVEAFTYSPSRRF
jgi:SAM-dependent methyltransferase